MDAGAHRGVGDAGVEGRVHAAGQVESVLEQAAEKLDRSVRRRLPAHDSSKTHHDTKTSWLRLVLSCTKIRSTALNDQFVSSLLTGIHYNLNLPACLWRHLEVLAGRIVGVEGNDVVAQEGIGVIVFH